MQYLEISLAQQVKQAHFLNNLTTLYVSVLSSGQEEYSEVSDVDIAINCGSFYCPAQLASTSEMANMTDMDIEIDNFETDITKIYIIAGIFLACSIMASLIIAFFVDPLTR
jgi:hypothetical protein